MTTRTFGLAGLATVARVRVQDGSRRLTLGGGFGYLTRRFGWAADNMEEVDIVTADGKIRIVSRAENPDLFWAIRGGGGPTPPRAAVHRLADRVGSHRHRHEVRLAGSVRRRAGRRRAFDQHRSSVRRPRVTRMSFRAL